MEFGSNPSGTFEVDFTHKMAETDHTLGTLLWHSDNKSGVPLAICLAAKDSDHYHMKAFVDFLMEMCPALRKSFAIIFDDDQKGDSTVNAVSWLV